MKTLQQLFHKLILASGLLLLVAPSYSFANGDISDVTVISVRAQYINLATVFFSSDVNNVASCSSSSYLNAFAWDGSTAAGKAMLSLALQAKATGAKVHAHGRGACITDNSIEDLYYIEFYPLN